MDHANRPADRRQRLAQLERLADEDFVVEVRSHQSARWRPGSLERHAKKHRGDFLEFVGQAFSPSTLDELSRDVLRSWDRLFTELRTDGSISYLFVRSLAEPDTVIIVVTRGRYIRSAFPTKSLAQLLWRRPAIEVTNRAKRLSL